jgi:hypothetical protein
MPFASFLVVIGWPPMHSTLLDRKEARSDGEVQVRELELTKGRLE